MCIWHIRANIISEGRYKYKFKFYYILFVGQLVIIESLWDICVYFSIYFHVYLKGRDAETKRKMERELPFHSLNDCSSQDWVRTKPGVWKSTWISTWCQGFKTRSHHLKAFNGQLTHGAQACPCAICLNADIKLLF